MTTTRTTQELATETMRMLGLLEAQEEASSEDAAHITRAYEDKLAELQFREIAYWTSTAIPKLIFRPVARIIAAEVASSFGKAVPVESDENGAPIPMGTKGLKDLRRIISREATGLPTVGQYF